MSDRDYPYVSAIIVVLIAFLIRLGLEPWLQQASPFLTFIVAIFIAAGRYGSGPGIAATISSLVLATPAFVAPDDPLHLRVEDLANIGLFLLASAAMLSFAAHLKASLERAAVLQAELQETQTEAAMGAMASTLAHELHQPLGAAANYLSACKRIGGELDRAEEARLVRGIDEAAAQIQRASRIICHARDMIIGKAAQREPASLRIMISRVMELLRAVGMCEHVRVRVTIAPDADGVMVNETQIEQVLMNLLRNACQAVQDDATSEIVISATAADHVSLVRVSDRGRGIPGEQLKSLFSPGLRSSSGGLGLGLSISRAIVEAHGGRLWAENNPDRGASFFFTVPTVLEVQSVPAGSSPRF